MPCERCKEVDKDSYAVVVDSIARSEVDLSPHEIRVKAARQFRPVYRAMQEAAIIENEGLEEYENGIFQLSRDGKMFFPSVNATADQLHENQRRSSELSNDPSKYSVSDHQRTQLVQLAFANGATIVRTSFIREDETNRDVIEYRLDRVTNMGVIRVINTAVTGKQHSAERIKEITREKSGQLHEVSLMEKVFIFTDAKIEKRKIQSAIRATDTINNAPGIDVPEHNFVFRQNIQSVKREYADAKSYEKNSSKSQVSEMVFTAGSKVIHDGIKVTAAMNDYIFGKIMHKKKERQAKKYSSKESDFRVNKNYLNTREKRSYQKSTLINKEILMKIHRKFSEFLKARKILTFVQSGVGAGAGIFALETLTRELPKSLRNIEKKRMKILRRKERKLVKKRESQESEKIWILAPSIKDSYKKEMRIKKQRKKDGSEALGKKVVRVEKKKISKREKKRKSNKEKRILLSKREIIIVQEHSRRPKRERRLKFVIGMLLRRLTKERVSPKNTAAKKKEKRVYSKKEMKQARVEGRIFKTAEARKKEVKMQKKKEKVMVLNFSFALAFWMLFLSESRDNNRAMILKQKGETEQSQSGQSEEPRPWILFSIIYYLAMIRESGARHSPQQKKTAKKKRKKLQKSIPQSGIIFAFPS